MTDDLRKSLQEIVFDSEFGSMEYNGEEAELIEAVESGSDYDLAKYVYDLLGEVLAGMEA